MRLRDLVDVSDDMIAFVERYQKVWEAEGKAMIALGEFLTLRVGVHALPGRDDADGQRLLQALQRVARGADVPSAGHASCRRSCAHPIASRRRRAT